MHSCASLGKYAVLTGYMRNLTMAVLAPQSFEGGRVSSGELLVDYGTLSEPIEFLPQPQSGAARTSALAAG
jgi:hypothetical protein